MLLELIIVILIGILIGTITGLLPGIHTNLVNVILISIISSIALSIQPFLLGILIITITLTHLNIDNIPSIFLGCPNEDTQITVLPGHELLLEGRGQEAITIAVFGTLVGIIIISLSASIVLKIIPSIYSLVLPFTKWFLLLIILALIFQEKHKFLATIIVVISGILGLLVLQETTLNEPLLPLFTGLFGISGLIISLQQKTKIPKQKPESDVIIKKQYFSPTILGIIGLPLVSLFPALGTGQLTTAIAKIKKQTREQFLWMSSVINSGAMVLSFWTIYALRKARTGTAVNLQSLIPQITTEQMIVLSTIMIFIGIIASMLTIQLSKKAIVFLERTNYQRTSLITLCFLVLIIFLVSGFKGILVSVAAAMVGIYAISNNVQRITLMGSLLIPTAALYFKII